MNERELLEFAAKAAGLKDARWDDYYNAISYVADNGIEDCPWNPLTSASEAFSLAVDLGMELDLPTRSHEVVGACVRRGAEVFLGNEWMEDIADVHVLARRAIVTAAARYGRSL